jgi:RND family efflux transporter MFP subunit
MTAIKNDNDRPDLLVRVVVPILVILVFSAGAVWLVKTKPAAGQRKPPPQIASVNVMIADITNRILTVSAMGEVIPSRQVKLQAQVSGLVVKQNPKLIQGGRFDEGEFMLSIEPDDFDAAVAQAESALSQAKLTEALEEQRHAVAVEEWSLSGQQTANDIAKQVALRIPHLEAARAARQAAEAALLRARRDRERTAIRAPFACVVLSENVDVGDVAAQQDVLAEVAGTEQFFVRATMPIGMLSHFAIPVNLKDKGACAIVRLQGSDGIVMQRTGFVVQQLGDLEQNGRMARVLIAVSEPLDESDVPLLLGSYVRCEIEGEVLSDVAVLPRSVVRDGSQVWVANEQNQLEVRDLDVVWQTQNEVYVSNGIVAGDRVVMTQLPAAIPGMELRVLNGESDAR